MNRTLADFQAAQQQQAAINVILLRSVVRLTVTARRFFLISGLRRSINRIWKHWRRKMDCSMGRKSSFLAVQNAFVNLVLALCDPVVMFQPYYSCESW
ncbi:hypothetical protein Bca4012_081007 [Brassica carinata]